MLYVCSCGFTAATATAFYKHLAASKEAGAGHQLTQARFSDKHGKDMKKSDDIFEATGAASWVEEYLVVDQQDIHGHGLKPLEAPLPVSSTSPPAAIQQSFPGTEMDDVPLGDLQNISRSWAIRGRLGSSAASRPHVPAARVSTSAVESQGAALDSDEVKLVEHIPRIRRTTTTSNGGAARTSGGGAAAQAALRMSGVVVNAMVVGLSPWRWFGNGNGGSSSRGDSYGIPECQGAGPGPFSELVGATIGGEGLEGRINSQRGDGGGDGTAAAHYYDAHWGAAAPAASLEAVHAVRDVLIWRNPWRTSRVFGAGIYLAVCARQLTKGHDLLQPSTAVFGLCFLLLLRNVMREAVASYRRTQQQQPQQQQQQQQEVSEAREADERLRGPSLHDEDAERRKAAMLLQHRLEAMFQPVALGAVRYGAALLVLGWGLLRGRRAITSALVAALLWLGMVLGELRLISQPTFWLLCYVAAFTIPVGYYRCRHAMDAGVEAVLRFVVRVLVSGSRVALLTSAGVAAMLVAVLPLNIVLRASLAAAAAFGVLLWQSEMRLQRHSGGGAGWSGFRTVGEVQVQGQGQGQLQGDSGFEAGPCGRLLTGPQRHSHGD